MQEPQRLLEVTAGISADMLVEGVSLLVHRRVFRVKRSCPTTALIRYHHVMDERESGPRTFTCDGCGACCKTFPIFASIGDAAREPRIRAEAGRLPASQRTAEWTYRLYPLPFLEACCFLDSEDRCTIYGTRPDVCRRFAAGEPQCQEARERRGLPALAPDG